MGRKSKLTPEQWALLGERLMAGEVAANLAREFGVPASSISERFSEQIRSVRKAAENLAQAQAVVNAMPPAQRRATNVLADKLVSISEKMASGVEYMASTYLGASSIANSLYGKIDPVDPFGSEESVKALKGLGIFTDIANKVAITPMNLLAANKEAFKGQGEEGAGVIRLVNDPDAD